MADNKKKIIVYSDWIELFESLTDDEAGKLIKHFFRYVNDQNPVAQDRITELSFIPIKQTLKRDLEKWESKLDERSISGRLGNLKRYYNDIYEDVKSNLITLEKGEEIAKSRKISHSDITNRLATKNIANIADSDNDSVSVSVNDIVNDIVIENNNTASPFSFFNSLINYGFDKNLVSDWLKVRKTKKATNTETSFNSFIKEIEKRNCNLNEILEYIIVKNWSGFKWSWYDTEKEKEKSFAKKEKESDPIVIGRQTMSTVQQNMDMSGVVNPWLKNE